MPSNQDLIKLIIEMRDSYALLALNTRRSDEAVPLVAKANKVIKESEQTEKGIH